MHEVWKWRIGNAPVSLTCSEFSEYLASRSCPADIAVEICAGQKENGAGSLSAPLLLLLGCGNDCKPSTALGAPACEYITSGFAAHPLAKAVIVQFLAIRRLKCPFHMLYLFLLL